MIQIPENIPAGLCLPAGAAARITTSYIKGFAWLGRQVCKLLRLFLLARLLVQQFEI